MIKESSTIKNSNWQLREPWALKKIVRNSGVSYKKNLSKLLRNFSLGIVANYRITLQGAILTLAFLWRTVIWSRSYTKRILLLSEIFSQIYFLWVDNTHSAFRFYIASVRLSRYGISLKVKVFIFPPPPMDYFEEEKRGRWRKIEKIIRQ